jgi:hypothetical protein
MNAAEFRCKREYLGLPASWFAGKLGVDIRTVQRWEARDGKVPYTAATLINNLYDGAAKAVSYLTVQQLKARDAGDEHPVKVPSNEAETMPDSELPASWFRMIAVRVAERTGQEVTYV